MTDFKGYATMIRNGAEQRDTATTKQAAWDALRAITRNDLPAAAAAARRTADAAQEVDIRQDANNLAAAIEAAIEAAR